MPVTSDTFYVFLSTWKMWAVVGGGLLFLRLCKWYYNYRKRFKRCF